MPGLLLLAVAVLLAVWVAWQLLRRRGPGPARVASAREGTAPPAGAKRARRRATARATDRAPSAGGSSSARRPAAPRKPAAAEPAATESEPGAAPRRRTSSLPRVVVEEDEDLEITKLTVTAEDTEETATQKYVPPVLPIVYDAEAAVDEPTGATAYILVSAVGQTDRGRKRRRNEDAFAVVDSPPLFVVADGMGGYAGGDVASRLAVDTLLQTFADESFDDWPLPGCPRRGSELVQAIQRANRAVFERATSDPQLSEMGTTIVCARFSPNKQRVYIGHVGDSRCYLLRNRKLHQITTDHTAAQRGITGPLASQLIRAVGIDDKLTVDLILGKPRPGDRYLLCSDGLCKMVKDSKIEEVIAAIADPQEAVERLIELANERGGKDNTTVILIRVDGPHTPSSPAPPPSA